MLSYRIARAGEALRAGNAASASRELHDAQRDVAAALLPLVRPHAEEARQLDGRRAGRWSG
jgi:hypothetical protein